MMTIHDAAYRLEFRLRQLAGATTLVQGGRTWAVHSANALKSVRQHDHADPFRERFFADVEPFDVFLDVGANYGSWTIPAATGLRPVKAAYALEPAPAPYLALLENVALNGCDARVHPLEYAVGATTDLIEFQIDTLDPSGGTGHPAGIDSTAHRPTGALWRPAPMRITVHMFSLDDLLACGAITWPTLIKIDVEGYEDHVLKGMREIVAFTRRLCIEIHPDRLGSPAAIDEVFAQIHALGFVGIANAQRGRQLHLLCERGA